VSLDDRTNQVIVLSQHEPNYPALPGWPPRRGFLVVDADVEGRLDPPHLVEITLEDLAHNAYRIKLTYEEAGLLADRLDLILGRE
jgi:hypothetical protein